MKKILEILILPVAIVIMLGGFANVAFAVAPVFTVQFEQSPLFSEANFLPNQAVTKWVDVTNNTSETETIGVNAKNYTSCSGDCFAGQLKLVISDGSSNLYEASLADFFAAGEKKLSDLGAGLTKRYNFIITFLPSAGNNYQNKQVGFDFDIGIFGQETIGGGGETSSGGSIGGGSYFAGDTGLIIFDEASSPVISNQTDITWMTNHPATSRVVYSSQYETHNFDLNNPPNYGYSHSNVEDSSPVVSHSMNIAGLVPGVTYYYRVVSRGSFAISVEHSFTAPGVRAAETGPEQGNINTGEVVVLNQGAGGGTITENNGGESNAGAGAGGENTGTENTNGENTGKETQNQGNLAGLFLASLGDLFRNGINFCSILFLFMVIATILLLLSLENHREDKNKERRWVFSIAAIVILIILYSFICPNYYKALLIIEVILFILFLLFYYFQKRKKIKPS